VAPLSHPYPVNSLLFLTFVPKSMPLSLPKRTSSTSKHEISSLAFFCSVADPDPGSIAYLTIGSGMGN
jgi:hypothetical protein